MGVGVCMSWRIMGRTFPTGISLKVNAIVQLEFEPAYYDVTVQHFIHSPWRLIHMVGILLYTTFLNIIENQVQESSIYLSIYLSMWVFSYLSIYLSI